MCGPKAGAIATRVIGDVLTYGSYEAVRKVPGPIGNVPKGAEVLGNQTAGGKPATADGIAPWDKKPPAPPAVPTSSDSGGGGGGDGGGDAGPAPTPSPNPTESAAMLAKRRLAAIRMGLLSTIATSGQGVTSAPSLFTPTATAVGSGTKTALGQ